MSWDALDAIADSVNPVLGIIALIWPWLHWRGAWRQAVINVVATLLSVGFAYLIVGLDGAYGWWPSIGLEFSTHTAVAVALVVSLCAIKPSSWIAWTAVLGAYIMLMIYQGYQSAADIFTTAAVVAPPVILWRWWLMSQLSHQAATFHPPR